MKTRPEAIARFITHKAAIDVLLARLAAASADHFGADPETLHWGDVGTAEEMARMLEEAVRFVGA